MHIKDTCPTAITVAATETKCISVNVHSVGDLSEVAELVCEWKQRRCTRGSMRQINSIITCGHMPYACLLAQDSRLLL